MILVSLMCLLLAHNILIYEDTILYFIPCYFVKLYNYLSLNSMNNITTNNIMSEKYTM